MSETLQIDLHWQDWLNMFVHFLGLSFLSIGGAIATTPEMHRFLVAKQGWMTDPQFTASITIAQAAPGPNVLFVALMGWNVGMNAAGFPGAWLGMTICMVGILLPSTCLTYMASNWSHRNRDLRMVRAFKQGMSPVVIGLLLGTSWIIASAHDNPRTDWPLWLLTVGTVLLVWRTRIHLLWLLGFGGVLGWFGVV